LKGRFLTAFPKVPLKLITHAPFLTTMQVSTDGGAAWKDVKVGRESEGLRTADFTWTLSPGTNTFHARVLSARGRSGRPSTVEVVW
jgi:hypothetical protein